MKRKLISFIIIIIICLTGLLSGTFASSKSIKWYSYDEGIATGHSERKKIYVNFHADWCGPCKYMEKTTFSKPAVISYLNKHFISIKVDIDKERKISDKYGARAIPDNWFLFKNGDPIGRRKGYIDPDTFMKILKSIQEDMGEKKKD
ncbi:MAG: thioredoxin family protein [Deltaproteobacteria bacterium]|nr:thioredoxin family protein [Deltaproteobacteria bacterium]